MKFKNREGSTLALTLMVFAVLMIFATFIMGFMVTENKQAMYFQNKTQAYYIARSGAEAVEAAILKIGEDQLDDLEEELPIDNIQVDGLTEEGSSLNVNLTKESDALVITSIAYVNDVNEKVEKVLKGESINNPIIIDHALFSKNNINIEGSGTVVGDMSTNASIILKGSANIRDIYLLEGQSLTAPNWWLNGWKKNYEEHRLDAPLEFPNYDFQPFPTVPVNNSTTNFSLGGVDTKTIYASTDYDTLSINNSTKFYIDTTAGDVILNIKRLNLNQGQIILIGNNKVRLYIGTFVMGGSATLNSSGSKENLTIHQYGNQKVDIGGSQKINGDFYIEQADLNIGNSASIQGDVFTKGSIVSLSGAQSIVGSLFIEKGELLISNSGSVHGSILTNGSKVNLSGSAIMAKGVLYAPNADVVLSGSGSVIGAVVSNKTSITGSGKIEYNASYVEGFPIPSGSSSRIVYKNTGYYR